MAEPEPPFLRLGPEQPAGPVILSVPHAGRAYSPELLRAARLPRAALESLEDRYVDRLIWRAVAAGATAFVALAPRAEIDLNRDEREIDPALIAPPPPAQELVQSRRTRGGIGLIPARLPGYGAIWKARIAAAELERRLATIHRPYHAAVGEALAWARDRFGEAVLLDCHSMPPRRHALAGEPGTLVIGDRHGTSCAPELVDAAAETARRFGFKVARNAPFPGGHIAAHHGRPAEGLHAIQIEIDRAAYLDVEMREPGPGFDDTCALIAALAEALAARLLAPEPAIAAE